MLKKDLLDLVAQLRTENSTLRTQLAAARTFAPGNPRQAAIARLHALYPSAKSFSAAEVHTEMSNRSCSA